MIRSLAEALQESILNSNTHLTHPYSCFAHATKADVLELMASVGLMSIESRVEEERSKSRSRQYVPDLSSMIESWNTYTKGEVNKFMDQEKVYEHVVDAFNDIGKNHLKNFKHKKKPIEISLKKPNGSKEERSVSSESSSSRKSSSSSSSKSKAKSKKSESKSRSNSSRKQSLSRKGSSHSRSDNKDKSISKSRVHYHDKGQYHRSRNDKYRYKYDRNRESSSYSFDKGRSKDHKFKSRSRFIDQYKNRYRDPSNLNKGDERDYRRYSRNKSPYEQRSYQGYSSRDYYRDKRN